MCCRMCNLIPHGHASETLSLPLHPPLLHVNTSMLECAQTAEHTLTYEHHLGPGEIHINTRVHTHLNNIQIIEQDLLVH